MIKLHAFILGLLLAFTGVFGAQANEHIPDYIGLYKAAQARNDKAAMEAIRQDMPQDLYSARENGLWGYINFLGEWVIAPKWVTAGNFRNGVAMVSETSWTEEPGDGIIDTSGVYLVPPKYLMVESQSGHYFGGKDTGHIIIAEWIDNGFGLTGYFDVSQHFYTKPQWLDVSLYNCDTGLLVVQDADSGKWGYVVKSTGIMKLPPNWDNVFAAIFNNGWAFMETYDEQTNTTTYSFVNQSGETLILPEGISICDDTFSNGLIMIKEDATGLFGYANASGTLVIQAQ